jgi:predicted nucleotidyltransferase
MRRPEITYACEGMPTGPDLAEQLIERLVAAARADERIVGVTLGGSTASGETDEFSDVDTVIVCEQDGQRELLASAREFAAGLGPLLAAFTGEHVGEPRLLICLYGPPLLHVDLKFVTIADLAERVEDGIVVWERDGAVSRAIARSPAAWPGPDPQWIEDRFWVWVHYAATKIGRGELFECLDALALLRAAVLGPLLAQRGGRRPQGVRRIERYAPDEVPALAATIGDHTKAGCIAALENAIALYRRLRDAPGAPEIQRRTEAESASVAYLAALET